MNLSRLRLSAPVMLVTAILSAGACAPADAAVTRHLCASREHAQIHDSPGGFVIGQLARPAKMTVLDSARRRRWLYVKVSTDLTGWIVSAAVCR